MLNITDSTTTRTGATVSERNSPLVADIRNHMASTDVDEGRGPSRSTAESGARRRSSFRRGAAGVALITAVSGGAAVPVLNSSTTSRHYDNLGNQERAGLIQGDETPTYVPTTEAPIAPITEVTPTTVAPGQTPQD